MRNLTLGPAAFGASGFKRFLSRAMLAAFLGVFVAAEFGAQSSGQRESNIRVKAQSNQTNTMRAASEGYVGSEACAQCHRRIYEDYSQTGMGRSLTRLTPELVETLPASASVHAPNGGPDIEVFTKNGKLYQSEHEIGADGQETFRDTHEVEWIIGSGANGFGGIIRKGDYLFQTPLSFYTKPQTWALSPGYEFTNFGFNRPILPGCIYCHSGQPKPVSNGNGRFKEPPFAEMAIGCENCHGPGITHALRMSSGKTTYSGNDTSIVNPARLSATLADNICMSCHQAGDVRVLKPGKNYGDFRSGTPLDNTLSILIVPPKRDAPPQSDHLEHYYSMTLSQCYQKSGGRLRCGSCHDPHVEPTSAEAPTYFAKKCLACHTERSCRLSLEVRRRQTPPDSCAGCHMPRRDVQVISHSSLTNHLILARADEPFPEAAFHQTTAALPDLIHVNPVPGRAKVTPSPLTLFQAYGELLDKRPEYLPRYLGLLDRLAQREPNNALVQAALGRRDLRLTKFPEAIEHLQKAVKIGPPQTATYADLAEALVRVNRAEEAMPFLEKALELDPFNTTLQKTKITWLINLNRHAEAKIALEQYVARFPEDSFMRQMLARANQLTTR